MVSETAEALKAEQLASIVHNLEIVKYVLVASVAVLCWDYLLTFSEEVALVWPSKWRLPKYLFLLNRYIAVVDPVLLMYILFVGGSAEFCVHTFRVLGWFTVVGFTIAQVIVLVRTLAIWERRPTLSIILITIFVSAIGVDCYVNTTYFNGISASPTRLPGINSCLLSFANRIVWIDFAFVIGNESIMLTLLIIKALQHFRHGRSTLMVTMYQDGIFHFSFILVTSIANACAILIAPTEIHNFLIVLQRVLHSIFCNRVLLHIRGSYHNQLQEDLSHGSRNVHPQHHHGRVRDVEGNIDLPYVRCQ